MHRNVIPANVLIGRDGTVKVMDFGIARPMSGGQTTATTVIGTAHYLSPEQIRGHAGDAQSDIYALGCVLHEMLCGAPPFTGRSPVAIASRHVREAPEPPSRSMPGLPRQVDAIVMKALSKNPENRYPTAAEMRADLQRALVGQIGAGHPAAASGRRSDGNSGGRCRRCGERVDDPRRWRRHRRHAGGPADHVDRTGIGPTGVARAGPARPGDPALAGPEQR